MYCPRCGHQTSEEQKYCRSCGVALEKVVAALVEQLPAEMDESLAARKRRLERRGNVLLSLFGLGLLGFLTYGIVYKVMIEQGRVWEGAVSALLAVYYFAEANELEAGRKKRAAPLEEDEAVLAAHVEPTAKLLSEAPLEPVPSVGEGTTEPLLVEKKRGA